MLPDLFHYNYRFVQRVDNPLKDDFLKYKLLYSFKSPKSRQWYWVWVEVYERDFYAVKFHLKAHRDSEYKYSLMTGYNEARPVINTCIAIMHEIANVNPHASFGFIGANMETESETNTKRFRVYSRFMASYFSQQIFKHFVVFSKSAYILVRQTELKLHPDLLDDINTKFKQLYPYFE